MFDLFIEGGPVFMGVLTIIFLLAIVQSIRTKIVFPSKSSDQVLARKNMTYIRSLGILAFVVGVLGQLIGLYQAFGAIQVAGDVSPTLLANGLRVSMLTTMYGTLIFIVCLVLWLALDTGMKSKTFS